MPRAPPCDARIDACTVVGYDGQAAGFVVRGDNNKSIRATRSPVERYLNGIREFDDLVRKYYIVVVAGMVDATAFDHQEESVGVFIQYVQSYAGHLRKMRQVAEPGGLIRHIAAAELT